MMVRWLIGLSVGTLIIAVTSPWFVRSYVPRQFDEVRQRIILSPGESYRWRAEGYATTSIGPHGMMGRTQLPTSINTQHTSLALWGDSQAEGVSVADSDKLWNQLEASFRSPAANSDSRDSVVHVLPLASSGDHVGDWTSQMPRAESELNVQGHIVLLCEAADLMAVIGSSDQTESVELSRRPIMNQVIQWVPDFVIHAGRNLFTDPRTMERRRLRFGVGPVTKPQTSTKVTLRNDDDAATAERWISDSLSAMREATTQSIWIVYAPRCPLIMDGKLRVDNSEESSWEVIRRNAKQSSIGIIDCRPAFRASVENGHFPHGFHNGQFGNGHLNAVGYQLIAREFESHLDAAARSELSEWAAGVAE